MVIESRVELSEGGSRIGAKLIIAAIRMNFIEIPAELVFIEQYLI